MAHTGGTPDPRGNVRQPEYTGDIENKKLNTGKALDEVGKTVDVEGQTPRESKNKIAEFLVEAKDKKLKSEAALKKKGFEPLELAAFSNFDDLVTEDGNLQGGAASSFTAQYVKNFGIDDPNYEVEVGEYGDGDYTVYLKKKNS
ncbi:hypothetical protein ACFL3T_02535 [Patescibacteria group bacterium]